MVNFEKTPRTAIQEALTRGISLPFSKATLERMITQEESFLKPKFNFTGLSIGTSLIPLAIIAFLVLKK
tara:strand:+ start:564 stop:770 length:207 start_codon:yes stop_codon:yes gene_type:complete